MDESSRPASPLSRRRLLAIGLGCATVGLPSRVWAANGVPPKQQSELLTKAGKYDRAMAERTVDGQLRLLLASRTDSSESIEFATLARKRLMEIARIGEYDLAIEDIAVERAVDIVPRLEVGDVAIAYLSTGLRSHIGSLAGALGGRSILTAAASPEYVSLGVVLGFDLVNGSPALLVNLRQARAQQVSFHASFLKLSKIVS